jgi:hypothetical protein
MYRSFNKTVPFLLSSAQFDLSRQPVCPSAAPACGLLETEGASDAAGGDEMFPGRTERAFSPSALSGLLYRLPT